MQKLGLWGRKHLCTYTYCDNAGRYLLNLFSEYIITVDLHFQLLSQIILNHRLLFNLLISELLPHQQLILPPQQLSSFLADCQIVLEAAHACISEVATVLGGECRSCINCVTVDFEALQFISMYIVM